MKKWELIAYYIKYQVIITKTLYFLSIDYIASLLAVLRFLKLFN